MKKFLSLIASTMLIVMCFALTACFPSMEKAKTNLEDAGYSVTVVDDQEELDAFAAMCDLEEGDITGYLTAHKVTINDYDTITVIYFASSSVAKDYYNEHCDTDEVDEDFILKLDGKIIYGGTEAAVEAAKG